MNFTFKGYDFLIFFDKHDNATFVCGIVEHLKDDFIGEVKKVNDENRKRNQ